MIETVMIFALGFFVSTLLGLIFVPALNERADRLARRRVEAQLPASVAELNAERDTLRAELAVRERRMEQRLELLLEKQARNMAELGRRATRIAMLTDEGEQARAAITGLEQDLAVTRNALAESEARAADLAAELLDTRETGAALDAALADLQARHDRALSDLDTGRIRVSDLQTRLEAETGRAREIERVSRSRAQEIAELRALVERTRKALADEEARGAVLERRVEDFSRARDEALAEQARVESVLAELRDEKAGTARDLAARHAELEKASARIAALDGHLAVSRRHLEQSEKASLAAQEEMRREIGDLRAQKSSLQGALEHARSERRRLEKDFAAYRETTEKRISAENALLRTRINEVTRLIMGESGITHRAEPGQTPATGADDRIVGRKNGRSEASSALAGEKSPAKEPAAARSPDAPDQAARQAARQAVRQGAKQAGKQAGK